MEEVVEFFGGEKVVKNFDVHLEILVLASIAVIGAVVVTVLYFIDSRQQAEQTQHRLTDPAEAIQKDKQA